MKANELRVGNLVNYKYYNPNPSNPDCAYESVELLGVLKDTFYFKTKGSKKCHKVGELHPIPLTDDWLNKFGFENGGYDLLFWRLNDFELAGNDFLNQGEEIPEYAYNWYLDDNIHKQILIHYVHQLQNLYFALTNEELTITQ